MIVGLNHVGISVEDLDAQVERYVGLGLEDFARFELDRDEDADRVADLTGAQVDAAMLRGTHGSVELFRFRHPDPFAPGMSRPPAGTGIRSFAVEREGAAGFADRLTRDGFRLEHTPTGTDAFGLADPEGVYVVVEEGAVARLSSVLLATANLDRLTEFYVDVVGLEPVGEAGTEGAVSVYRQIAGVGERPTAVLAVGAATIVVMEVDAPAPDVDRPVFLPGINHLCLEVSDVDAEYRRLDGAGMRFHCPPVDLDEGQRLTYGRDPDGNVVEIWQGDPATGLCLGSASP